VINLIDLAGKKFLQVAEYMFPIEDIVKLDLDFGGKVRIYFKDDSTKDFYDSTAEAIREFLKTRII
jgi:hypothetical protein